MTTPSSGEAAGFNQPLLGALPQRQKLVIVGATLLALFVAAINQTVIATALPHIVSDLGGFEKFSWVFTSFMLTSTVSSPVWGKLSDRWGRKIFLVTGTLVFIITSAASGLVQSMDQLIVLRAVQGFGAGMVMACGFTVIGDLYAPAERARYQGVFAGVFGIASITGPLVGGSLTDAFSWRFAFYANVPVGLVALPILLKFLPTVRGAKPGPIDMAGVVTMSAAVVPLLLGFVWAGTQYPWDSPQIIGLLAFSGVMAICFIIVEARAKDALIPLDLFRNRTYAVVSLVTFLMGLAMFGATVYVPLFAQGVIGISATSSGFVTAPMMMAMVVASAIAGNIMSRTGKYKVLAMLGITIMTGGLFLLSTMGASTTRLTASAFMIVAGFGIGTVMPLLNTVVQNAVPARMLGVVTSNMQFYRSIGGTLGVAVMGAIVTGQLAANLPPPHPALAALPPELVARLQDPQALVSSEIRASLAAAVSQLPAGDAIFASALESLRLSLAEALHWAFLASVSVAVFGIGASTLLKEEPLRSSKKIERAADASAAPPRSEPQEDLPQRPAPPEMIPAGVSGNGGPALALESLRPPERHEPAPSAPAVSPRPDVPVQTEVLLAVPRYVVSEDGTVVAVRTGNGSWAPNGTGAVEPVAPAVEPGDNGYGNGAHSQANQLAQLDSVVSERLYAFTATAGIPVALVFDAELGNSSNLSLFGPSGSPLVWVEESAAGRGRISFTPRVTGRHTVIVRYREPLTETGTAALQAEPDAVPAAPAPERRSRLRTFESLKDPTFAWFFLSNLAQMSAAFMQILVRGFLVYELTGSFTALGFISLIGATPQLLFGIYGGVLADRFPKKTVTQVGLFVGFANVLVMGIIASLGVLQFWHLVVTAIGQGLLVGMMMPARQAMIHEVVKGKRLMNAISLNAAGTNIIQILSPAVGGIVISAWGAQGAFFTMAGGYGLSLIGLMFVPKAPAAQTGKASAKAAVLDIFDGMRYVKRHQQLGPVLLFSFLVAFLGSAYMPLFPGFVSEVFGGNASMLGLLVAISAGGSLVGSLTLASLRDRKRGWLLMTSGTLLGLGLAGLALSPSVHVAMVFMVVIGLGSVGGQSIGNTLLQVYSEDAYRGRVIGIFMLQFSMMSFGAFAIGLMAGTIPIQVAYGGVAAILVAVGLIAAATSRTLRGID